MPKMKTNSSAKKRFHPSKKRKTTTLKSRRAFRNHLATHKPAKRMARLRKAMMVGMADVARVLRMLRRK